MFSIAYVVAEVRRRFGRTAFTALGLGVGVALVVCVSALSDGLEKAQDEVLEPLTGVGTDMSVTRPLEVRGEGDDQTFGPGGLSEREREQLQEENQGGGRFGLRDLGEPGEKFTRSNFIATSQLSFPASELQKLSTLDGVTAVAGALTLTNMNVSGTVPEEDELPDGPRTAPPAPGAGGAVRGPRNIDIKSLTVTGLDPARSDLAPVTPAQVSDGRYLRAGAVAREAMVSDAYAKREKIDVGDKVEVGGKKFDVVGISTPPLGGAVSDVYVELADLQRMSDRVGRVNVAYVRTASSDQVDGVAAAIERTLDGASVTTASELADRVGGSLGDAKDLSGRLGTALALVGLLAAVLIASLLTLSSVAKRTRELGTLKALGWPQRLVVRQVTGEALAQGLLGGVAGVALGLGGAALISALAPELEASVAAPESSAAGGPQPGGGFLARLGGGASQIASGTRTVQLDAPVDLGLLALAVGLAIAGGLLAGAVGGLRAARLRPAVALRSVE